MRYIVTSTAAWAPEGDSLKKEEGEEEEEGGRERQISSSSVTIKQKQKQKADNILGRRKERFKIQE